MASSCPLSAAPIQFKLDTKYKGERETGFEPATSTLAIKSSGIVLRRAACPSYVRFIWLYSEPIELRLRLGPRQGHRACPSPQGTTDGLARPDRCLGLATNGFSS